MLNYTFKSFCPFIIMLGNALEDLHTRIKSPTYNIFYSKHGILNMNNIRQFQPIWKIFTETAVHRQTGRQIVRHTDNLSGLIFKIN